MDRRLLESEEPTASPRRSPETHGSQRVPRSPQPANAARAPSTDGSPGPPRPAGSRLVPGLSQRTVRPAASRPSVYAGAARLALIGTCPPRCRFLGRRLPAADSGCAPSGALGRGLAARCRALGVLLVLVVLVFDFRTALIMTVPVFCKLVIVYFVVFTWQLQ